MCTAICSYDEQAFHNMSEESGKKEKKKKTAVKKSLQPFPNQGMVEQAKKNGDFRPQRGYPGNAIRPWRA